MMSITRRAMVHSTAAAALLAMLAGPAAASDTAAPAQDWTFQGPFGRFDQAQLRRGFQVFSENCATCHSVRYLAYRDLAALGIGFGPEDIRTIASQYKVEDGPDEKGKMFMRPAKPADSFALPYPNKESAQLANRGLVPPDLSLMTRARVGGPDHLYAFLTGYGPPPDGVSLAPGMSYNAAIPGGLVGMKSSLFPDAVTYEDGTDATVSQMAEDVTAFLAWAADPHMHERKSLGLRVVIFLALLTAMFIALKLEVWAPLHGPRPRRDEVAPPAGGTA